MNELLKKDDYLKNIFNLSGVDIIEIGYNNYKQFAILRRYNELSSEIIQSIKQKLKNKTYRFGFTLGKKVYRIEAIMNKGRSRANSTEFDWKKAVKIHQTLENLLKNRIKEECSQEVFKKGIRLYHNSTAEKLYVFMEDVLGDDPEYKKFLKE